MGIVFLLIFFLYQKVRRDQLFALPHYKLRPYSFLNTLLSVFSTSPFHQPSLPLELLQYSCLTFFQQTNRDQLPTRPHRWLPPMDSSWYSPLRSLQPNILAASGCYGSWGLYGGSPRFRFNTWQDHYSLWRPEQYISIRVCCNQLESIFFNLLPGLCVNHE